MERRKQPKREFVQLDWDDAWQDLGALTEDDIDGAMKPHRLHTWGWLLRDTEVGVMIACEWVESADSYRDRTFVPRAGVVKLTKLRLSNAKRDKEPEAGRQGETPVGSDRSDNS